MLEDLDWAQLAGTIASPTPMVREDKKELVYFVPCLLRDDVPMIGKTLERARKLGEPEMGAMRSASHVTSTTYMVFEFDDFPAKRIREDFGQVLGHGRAGLLYTTYSHGREGTKGARLRLVLPVDTRLNANAYREAHELLNTELFDGLADRTGKSLCQQQAVFGVHPDRAWFAKRWVYEGRAFELAAFVAEHGGKPQIRRARVAPTHAAACTPREALPSLGRIESAMPFLRAVDYQAWSSGLIAFKALAPHYPPESVRALALAFAGTSPSDSTRAQAVDDPRYDPEAVFDSAQPVMPPGAAAGMLLGKARDRAVELVTDARATRKASPAAQQAANYLAAFHRRRWDEMSPRATGGR